MEKPKMAVSFSGGRTSAYMSYLIKKHWAETHELHFIFANTGKENEETLIFVDQCDRAFGLNVAWVEAINEAPFYRVVNFETASRGGQPFEEKIKQYGIPNMAFPWCTRELKSRPIRAYQVSVFGYDYDTAIGIRMDEFDRMSANRKEKRFIYPLIQNWPSTKQDVKEFWAKQDFDLKLKDYQGNCDLCWKKSLPKLLKICKESPKKAAWWKEMEQKYSEFKPETQSKRTIPSYFGRKHTSVKEMISISENTKYLPSQLNLFHGGSSCDGESCDAFSEEQ